MLRPNCLTHKCEAMCEWSRSKRQGPIPAEPRSLPREKRTPQFDVEVPTRSILTVTVSSLPNEAKVSSMEAYLHKTEELRPTSREKYLNGLATLLLQAHHIISSEGNSRCPSTALARTRIKGVPTSSRSNIAETCCRSRFTGPLRHGYVGFERINTARNCTLCLKRSQKTCTRIKGRLI